MAIRQYIGARYVLKVYENSQDPQSADWEAGVYYEPLVMVNYNNSSYISRKAVPANIGNPVSNPTYWALSGLYNGQIAQLQNDIRDLEQFKADNEFHRGFIFCGDSYDTINSPITWSDTAASLFGCDYYVRCSGSGYGFAPVGANTGKTWYSLVSAATIDDAKITDICVCGGLNDTGATDADLLAAMTAFDTYCKNRFPNLKHIYCGYLGFNFGTGSNVYNNHINVIRYQNYVDSLGWIFLDGLQYIMRNPLNVKTGDTAHPSSAATILIGQAVAAALKAGSYNYKWRGYSTFIIDANKAVGGDQNFYIDFEIRGGVLKVATRTKGLTLQADLNTASGSNFMTGDMVNFFTSLQPINILTRTAGDSQQINLLPNSSNVNALDLSIPSGATFATNAYMILLPTYHTTLL